MTTRLIRDDELSGLLALYRQLNPSDAPLLPDRAAATFETILANPWQQLFVTEHEGQLVATCALALVPNLTRGARPYGVIENVVTDAAYRRRRFGTEALRAALSFARQNDCYKVMLFTGSKRPETLAFYERVGFLRGDKTGFIARPHRD